MKQPRSRLCACVCVVILSFFCTATVWGQLATEVLSPSGKLLVLNVGEGDARHFEIQDTENGYRTMLSSADLQFRSEPISRAAVDAVWSPDSSSIAIEIALSEATTITCVYSRQGETFSPLPLDVFQAHHKVVPIAWHGSHDLTVSIDGPYPVTADHPAHGRLSTFRFRPNKSRFEKVYDSPPSRLKPAKLVLCLDRADDPEIRKFREKQGRDGDFFRRRDTAVLLSGPAAKDALASLLSAPHRPSQSMTTGFYGLGLLFYVDEHDRARWSINTTDAPMTRIYPTQSNSLFIWSIYTPMPPQPGEGPHPQELYTARDFYHKLLPELRRVNSKEIEHLEDFVRRLYSRSLEELIDGN